MGYEMGFLKGCVMDYEMVLLLDSWTDYGMDVLLGFLMGLRMV